VTPNNQHKNSMAQKANTRTEPTTINTEKPDTTPATPAKKRERKARIVSPVVQAARDQLKAAVKAEALKKWSDKITAKLNPEKVQALRDALAALTATTIPPA